MKASFLRRRKMARAVLVLDSALSSLEPYLLRKNFRVFTLPASSLDEERKALLLAGRTVITKTPQEFEDAVPVWEFSVIDVSKVGADDATLADIISRAWTRFQLKSEGWFILRLRPNGQHKLEFPE